MLFLLFSPNICKLFLGNFNSKFMWILINFTFMLSLHNICNSSNFFFPNPSRVLSRLNSIINSSVQFIIKKVSFSTIFWRMSFCYQTKTLLKLFLNFSSRERSLEMMVNKNNRVNKSVDSRVGCTFEV